MYPPLTTSPSPVRPVLLGCPECGNPRLLLHVDTRIPVTVTQSAADPFDPAGYQIHRVDHSPAPALEPRPTGVTCTGCGWSTHTPNWTDHLTPAGL